MKRIHGKRIRGLAAFVILCASATGASAIDIPPPGAAACSGCHPAGRSVDTTVTRLAGRNPSDIVTAMDEFRSGKRPGTVMDRIAKGFSDDEVKAIAAWYAKQKD
jgi:sulfide dehydrogenase cytochrome subunit